MAAVPRQRRRSMDEPPKMSGEASLRILVVGGSSRGQVVLSRSVLGSESITGDAGIISATRKDSGLVQGRKMALINLPNLRDAQLPLKMLNKEFRKAVCFSCPGPHVLLLVLDPFSVTSETTGVLKHVIHYFGELILKHTLIVLHHEKSLQTLSMDEEVKRNKNFRLIADKCEQNYIFFTEEYGEFQIEALITKIDEMVSQQGIFSNLEFSDTERRIEREERLLGKSKQKETSEMRQSLEKEFSGETLAREIQKYEEKVQVELREKAEQVVADKLGFAVRVVDYAVAIGKGALVGAVLGFAVGYQGMALGAFLGAGVGGFLGGAVKAVWSYINNSLASVQRNS